MLNSISDRCHKLENSTNDLIGTTYIKSSNEVSSLNKPNTGSFPNIHVSTCNSIDPNGNKNLEKEGMLGKENNIDETKSKINSPGARKPN